MLTDLDEALERLHAFDLERGDGFTNQGPMVAQALSALGHPSLIPAFTDVYLPRLRPMPEGQPIAHEARGRALGDRARRADWLATFEGEIAEHGCDAVVERFVPDLLPGAFAAAGFGALRTWHALSGLAESDQRVRRRELAFGLAHWASRYQVLPGQPGVRPESGRTLADVLERSQLSTSDRRRIGRMSDAVLVLEGDAAFVDELAAVDLDANGPADALWSLSRCAAQLYLAHPESRVVYGQALRVAVAFHGLLGALPTATHPQLVGGALQIVLALHSVYGTDHEAGEGEHGEHPECDPLAVQTDEIRYRAACSGEEDAITVTQACLRAHAVKPDENLLCAAADAALHADTGHAGRGA